MAEPRVSEEIEVVETVEAVIVTDARPLPARRTQGEIVAARAAVVGTSFVAGAVTAVVVARRRSRKASRRSGRGTPRGLDVAATRSFLVDVHLLNR